MAFLLGETRDVRELVKKESEAARAELEKRAAELSEETKQETDRIKEIFKASRIKKSIYGKSVRQRRYMS